MQNQEIKQVSNQISDTNPKATQVLSIQGVGCRVMQNWDPLVWGPLLAIPRVPRLVCDTAKLSSKIKGERTHVTDIISKSTFSSHNKTVDALDCLYILYLETLLHRLILHHCLFFLAKYLLNSKIWLPCDQATMILQKTQFKMSFH